MPSNFAQLNNQDFSDLEAAAKAWRKLSSTMDSLTSRHRERVTGPLHNSWKGDDAESALFFLEDVESRLGIAETEAMAIASVLENTQFWMEQAQTELRNAVRRAEEDGYAVDADGWVSDPTTANIPRNDPDARHVIADRSGLLGEYRARIDKALADAERASDKGAKALADLNGDILTDSFNHDAAAESAADAKSAMKALGIQDPQIPKDDPKAASEWWKALSPEERQEYAALYPKQIGATDGLPATVRDDANRTALAQELNLLQEGNLKEAYPGESPESHNQRLANALKMNEQLNERDSARSGKELYLLGYDSKGDGRAIVAMGNPDTAAHTGVLVPGTNTDVASEVDGQITRIDKLHSAADKHADGEDVAMITWLGYDAPKAMGDGGVDGVATRERAYEAGPDLRQFTEGMRASHEGTPSHTTVIGHSYGSTVVGAAASEGKGLGVDDVVVVGSPGMAVKHASELQMDQEHVWAGGAEDDKVIKWAGGSLGRDPLRENFGGNNFEVDTSGHSGYWDKEGEANSDSLENQGKIIANRPPTEAPKKEPDSGDVPPRPPRG
ncbi:alpha/beta hydrolase [Streptomyces cavernicola]|uniref:Alpha/beta hydrolase n=1 Tax=Streptomyces cavernicola TaxID=3043613 RepID=A0ABT6SMF4_9ACTN|nr:alpha/beta hydrolase [Streptomyces sp. B-S-A6]MDI3408401.1 alpha/beta hydrolase [Streptomyces sp. B-S-A6]